MSRSMSARRPLVPRCHRRFSLLRVHGEFDQPVEQECAHYTANDDARDRAAAHALAGAAPGVACVASVLAGLKDGFCERGREFLR